VAYYRHCRSARVFNELDNHAASMDRFGQRSMSLLLMMLMTAIVVLSWWGSLR
jgi:hypothetical protein